jgi:DNA-binding Lrp family transcriptional regulator
MKLTANEKKILVMLIENPALTNSKIAKQMGLSSQAIGKIRQGLFNKKIIKNTAINLDYSTLGISCFCLALVKIMPKTFRKHKKELDNILANPNILMLINVPQTAITNIMLFGFKDIFEYNEFFTYMKSMLPGLIEIKESYVFSSESLIRNSSSSLFKKIIKEMGHEVSIKKSLPSVNS